MHQEAKKGMLLTLGAIGLVGIGALIAVLMFKFTKTESSSTASAVVQAPVAQAPVAVAQAPVAEAPAPQAPAAATIPQPATSTMAEVTRVQPHYSIHSYPVRVCHHVPRTTLVESPPGASNGTSGVGAVVGVLAGGALGNQIGQGRGKTAATIGGAVLGALAGNHVEGNMNQPPPPHEETEMVQVCHTRYLQKSVVKGYDVGYVYNGQPGNTHMKYAPAVGSTFPLTLQPG